MVGSLLVDAFHYLALFAIGGAIVWSAVYAFIGMTGKGHASIDDILLLFIYLELGAMVGIYFKTNHMPVRFLIYVGITALTRLLVGDIATHHKLDWGIVMVAGAILLLGAGEPGGALRLVALPVDPVVGPRIMAHDPREDGHAESLPALLLLLLRSGCPGADVQVRDERGRGCSPTSHCRLRRARRRVHASPNRHRKSAASPPPIAGKANQPRCRGPGLHRRRRSACR